MGDSDINKRYNQRLGLSDNRHVLEQEKKLMDKICMETENCPVMLEVLAQFLKTGVDVSCAYYCQEMSRTFYLDNYLFRGSCWGPEPPHPPIITAVKRNLPKVLKALLDHRNSGDLAVAEPQGMTPLMWALAKQSELCLQGLLDAGAAVAVSVETMSQPSVSYHLRDKDADKVLNMCLREGPRAEKIVRALIKVKAGVSVDHRVVSPLMLAVGNRWPLDIIELLILNKPGLNCGHHEIFFTYEDLVVKNPLRMLMISVFGQPTHGLRWTSSDFEAHAMMEDVNSYVYSKFVPLAAFLLKVGFFKGRLTQQQVEMMVATILEFHVNLAEEIDILLALVDCHSVSLPSRRSSQRSSEVIELEDEPERSFGVIGDRVHNTHRSAGVMGGLLGSGPDTSLGDSHQRVLADRLTLLPRASEWKQQQMERRLCLLRQRQVPSFSQLTTRELNGPTRSLSLRQRGSPSNKQLLSFDWRNYPIR